MLRNFVLHLFEIWYFEQQLKWLTSARKVSSRYEHLQKPRNISTVIPGLCELIIAHLRHLYCDTAVVYMTPLPSVPMKHWKFRVFMLIFPENFICKEIPNKWFILKFAIFDGWVHNANHQMECKNSEFVVHLSRSRSYSLCEENCNWKYENSFWWLIAHRHDTIGIAQLQRGILLFRAIPIQTHDSSSD